MGVYIASLNSGSNGNCYYVGNETAAVLIDAGISCREIEIRMKKCGLDIQLVKAIFISHEHSDHIKGVSVFANKYKVPVYITPSTAKNGPKLIKHLSKPVYAHQPIQIESLLVIPFSKEHDAADPHSFVVSDNGINIAVITDIGVVCNHVRHYFQQCHAAFLESNYDETLLETGRYSQILKDRIRGGKGHISNKEAGKLLDEYSAPHLSLVLLSHLSAENNSPELALQSFANHTNRMQIAVASRYQATEVFKIGSAVQLNVKPIPTNSSGTQLGLF
jgi:phosphoribosyl 1,2-cyclic phosphodiesterase